MEKPLSFFKGMGAEVRLACEKTITGRVNTYKIIKKYFMFRIVYLNLFMDIKI
jgi:hypothetical protein